MYVKDLPLLNILSEGTIKKLSISKGWTEQYSAAWSYLYFKRKQPPLPMEINKIKNQFKLKEIEK